MKFFTIGLLLTTSLAVMANGSDWEDQKQKMEERTDEAARDTGRGVKSTTRKVQDETCEMVNGKAECAVKKSKHTIQNAGDKFEDAMD